MQRDGISVAEYRQLRAAAMSEKQLQDVIIASAKRHGWLVYHTFDSRRSEAGYPDLHLVHLRAGVGAFRELKTETGRLSTAQQKWMAALAAAGHDVAVWRPHDWVNDTIPNWLADADPSIPPSAV